MSANPETTGYFDQLAEWAAKQSNIEELWLYGSRAKGTERSDSDLDLAVILVDKPYSDRMWVAFDSLETWCSELKKIVPFKVHLEVGDADIAPDVVSPAIKEHGILIYKKG